MCFRQMVNGKKLTCSLDLVGDDAAHKVRCCGIEDVHEAVELLLVLRGDGHDCTTLLLLASLLSITCSMELTTMMLTYEYPLDNHQTFLHYVLTINIFMTDAYC